MMGEITKTITKKHPLTQNLSFRHFWLQVVNSISQWALFDMHNLRVFFVQNTQGHENNVCATTVNNYQ